MVCYCSKHTNQHFSIKFFYKILVPQVLKQIFRKKQSWEWVQIPESNGNAKLKSNRFLLLFSCVFCFFVFLSDALLRPSTRVTLLVMSKRALPCAVLPNLVRSSPRESGFCRNILGIAAQMVGTFVGGSPARDGFSLPMEFSLGLEFHVCYNT